MKLEPTIEIGKRTYVPLHVVTPEAHGLFYVPTESFMVRDVVGETAKKLVPVLTLVEPSKFGGARHPISAPFLYVTPEQLSLNQRVLPKSRVTKCMAKHKITDKRLSLHSYGLPVSESGFHPPCLDSEFWRRKFLRRITWSTELAQERIRAALLDLTTSQKLQRELLETFGMYKERRK